MKAPLVAGADLFGQVPITSHDLFAWLLCVPRIDPATPQAGNYVRGYDVLQKIARAKADGGFDEVLARAQPLARFQQLVEEGLPPAALADLFELQKGRTLPMVGKRPKAKLWHKRPSEVVRAEQARLAYEREQRRTQDMSLLRRLPSGVPSLSCLLSEIGNPSAYYLARAMQVPTQAAAQWIEEDHAPHAVMLALFWLTRWGVSMIDAEAHNAAILNAQLAAANRRDADGLRSTLARVERIADFGSANDPMPSVHARQLALAPRLVVAKPVPSAPTASRTQRLQAGRKGTRLA